MWINLLKIIEREPEPEYLLNEAERLRKLLSKAPSSANLHEELRAKILKANEELCIRIRRRD